VTLFLLHRLIRQGLGLYM